MFDESQALDDPLWNDRGTVDLEQPIPYQCIPTHYIVSCPMRSVASCTSLPTT